MFTDMVNVSDEALVMQVVRYYFPRWDKGEVVVEEKEIEDSSEIGSRHSGGAEKGERLTCSRTSSAFYDYCRKVKAARESLFRTKWDEPLQGVALERHKEEMEDEEKGTVKMALGEKRMWKMRGGLLVQILRMGAGVALMEWKSCQC